MTLYNYTYQYAMLSYLEYPILIVQEYILLALVFKYKRMFNQNNVAGIAAYFLVVLLFAYQICPRFLLSMAVVSCIVYSIFSLNFKLMIPLSFSAILHANRSNQQSASTYGNTSNERFNDR